MCALEAAPTLRPEDIAPEDITYAINIYRRKSIGEVLLKFDAEWVFDTV
jgi:hypothetical protein